MHIRGGAGFLGDTFENPVGSDMRGGCLPICCS